MKSKYPIKCSGLNTDMRYKVQATNTATMIKSLVEYIDLHELGDAKKALQVLKDRIKQLDTGA